MPKRNGVIPNAHFKKHWQRRVRTWFDQPGKKKTRRLKRLKKAAAIAPRPAAGLLRPVVHCPTFRYNSRGAGISRHLAPRIGIAVDHRRRNRSLEGLQPEACKMAVQLRGPVMPIRQVRPVAQARAVTEDEKKYSVFEAMRQARADKRLLGVREKRARQKAEEEKTKKK
ncbi:60S ribosomal protein L13 [Geodia barretti]|uniref:Large ribosomal subunit protein eL13 n=1 Tax=Geodia barretti TaxID=519541 RepID=A0AA35STI9_GEOBA|nr:60S ribosomal protein L13 [Geodia barretti]